MQKDPLTQKVIGCAIEVHRALGPGLLESTYETCLCYELGLAGIAHRKQVALPIKYKGVLIDCAYRIDLLIQDSLIVEIKAVDALCPSTMLNFSPI
jgi:GxxExxY protein